MRKRQGIVAEYSELFVEPKVCTRGGKRCYPTLSSSCFIFEYSVGCRQEVRCKMLADRNYMRIAGDKVSSPIGHLRDEYFNQAHAKL